MSLLNRLGFALVLANQAYGIFTRKIDNKPWIITNFVFSAPFKYPIKQYAIDRMKHSMLVAFKNSDEAFNTAISPSLINRVESATPWKYEK